MGSSGTFAHLVGRARNAGSDSQKAGCLGGRAGLRRVAFRGAFASAAGADICHQRTSRRRASSSDFCSPHRALALWWVPLWSPHLGDYPRKGRLLVSANAAWVIALAIFALSRSFASSLRDVVSDGGAQSVFTTLVITLMQGSVEAKMRGRIMSLNTLLMMGVRPLGDFPVSVATSFFGIANAALLSAAVVAVAGVLVFSFRPAIWRS